MKPIEKWDAHYLKTVSYFFRRKARMTTQTYTKNLSCWKAFKLRMAMVSCESGNRYCTVPICVLVKSPLYGKVQQFLY